MKNFFCVLLPALAITNLSIAQSNTAPLPDGETVIGGHLHAANDEVWTTKNVLYFNWKGNAAATHFWNLGTGAGKSIMTLLNTGKVGIGTPIPLAPLHIEGSVNEVSLLIKNVGVNPPTRTYLTAYPEKSSIETDKDFTIMTNGGGWSDKFAVTNEGKVGIGTNIPESSLDVFSPVNSVMKIRNGGYTDGYAQLALEAKRWASPGNQAGFITNASGSTLDGVPTETFGIYSRWRPIVFAVGNNGTCYESMRITGSGFVGIGTDNPDAKLTVKGDIHTKEVRIDVTGSMVPDYVFEKDYNLLPLSELETYISQNKHLPEVPSAKEMEADGLNLKEMNLLLLKKVEELTLHLIEIKKENLSQQEQINTLRNECKK